MAEIERDEQVTQAYRALGEETPPAALDQAILAASRQRGSRWAVPVSAAAALVLAVAVAVIVGREAPNEAGDVAPAPRVRSSQAPAAAPPVVAEARSPQPAAAAAPEMAARPEPSVAAKREAPASRTTDLAKAQESVAPAAPAAAGALRQGAVVRAETPGQWLERIAKLREAGRDQEADDSLAEFRRRYPDYKIPREMRARVLGR